MTFIASCELRMRIEMAAKSENGGGCENGNGSENGNGNENERTGKGSINETNKQTNERTNGRGQRGGQLADKLWLVVVGERDNWQCLWRRLRRPTRSKRARTTS